MNAEEREYSKQPHTLSMRDRGQLEMRGVTDVISFDEDAVELSTTCGRLTVEGDGLHVKVLNLAEGIVAVNGKVTALTYAEQPKEEPKGIRGFFGKRGH